jgi:hypothetical protein
MKTQSYKPDDCYVTCDLSVAVTLSLFFPLESIDKSNPRKANFVFKRSAELDEKLRLYWRRELQVEPQAFSSQLKNLKTRLYYE